MSDNHSTTQEPSGKPAKPSKPYADFPLTPHPSDVGARRFAGKLHYFGSIDNPDAALAKFLEQKDALLAGRKPRPDSSAVTVKELCNTFLTHKKGLLDASELTAHTWTKYKTACDEVVITFGKSRMAKDVGPDDFAFASQTHGEEMGRVSPGRHDSARPLDIQAWT